MVCLVFYLKKSNFDQYFKNEGTYEKCEYAIGLYSKICTNNGS